MPSTVTRDVKRAKRIVCIKRGTIREMKQQAQRVTRRVERVRLRQQGEDYISSDRPRMTGWDVA